MKKNKLYLVNNPYKKPISKKNLLYYSLPNKSNSNGEILNINTNFEEPILNNHLIETIKTATSKRKYNYLYSNFKLFKKLKQNSPYSNIGKISSHDILKKKRLKDVYEMQDNNSFFFQYKEEEGKLFTNYNNTCNICLNQHFYNIDYNNLTSSSSNFNRVHTETDRAKKINHYINIINFYFMFVRKKILLILSK